PPLDLRGGGEAEGGERRPAARVAAADREGRRGDRVGDAEGAGGAADQGRLPRPEVAADDDDVAGPELVAGRRRGRAALLLQLPRDLLGARHRLGQLLLEQRRDRREIAP